MRAARAAAIGSPQLTYRQGPLLTNVEVFSFYWGSRWQQDPYAGYASQIDGFFNYILTSPLLDQLGEYSVPGQTISQGTYAGSVIVTDDDPASSVSDTDIQNFIQGQIMSNMSVPQASPNTLYFVYVQPGTTVVMGGSASCQAFCGYHNDISGQVFYGVLPYPSCQGCTGGMDEFSSLTVTTSHELCEAITDPVPGQGWYDDNNGEIGDICAWQTKTLGDYTVQLEWSNQQGQCV
jgi:hypothetical protein